MSNGKETGTWVRWVIGIAVPLSVAVGAFALQQALAAQEAAAEAKLSDQVAASTAAEAKTAIESHKDEAAVKNAIRAAAPGGGYLLSAAHSHPFVDATRLRWMLEAAHRYGEYPIRV